MTIEEVLRKRAEAKPSASPITNYELRITGEEPPGTGSITNDELGVTGDGTAFGGAKANGVDPVVQAGGDPGTGGAVDAPPHGLSREVYDQALAAGLTPAQVEAYYGEFDPRKENYLQRVYEAANEKPEIDEKEERRRATGAALADAFGSLAQLISGARGGLVPLVQEGAVDRNERRSAGDRDRFLQRMQAYDAGMARAIQGDYANAMARYNRDHAAAERGLERRREDDRRADDALRRQADIERQQGNEDRRFAEMQRVNDENIALRKATQQATAANNSARTAAYVNKMTGSGAGGTGTKKKSMRVPAEEGWPEAKQDVDGKYYVTIEADDDHVSKLARLAMDDPAFLAAFPKFKPNEFDAIRGEQRAPTANERLELARAYYGYYLKMKNEMDRAMMSVSDRMKEAGLDDDDMAELPE